MLGWLQLLKEVCLASADFSFPFTGDSGLLCISGESQHEGRYWVFKRRQLESRAGDIIAFKLIKYRD